MIARRCSTGPALGLALIAAGFLPLSGGCTSRITPPCAPADPRAVFLVDYGYHSSIILPRDDRTLVEFAYGEYEWFALSHSNTWRAIELVLWPHAGTLGTRDLPGPSDADELRRSTVAEQVYTLEVPGAAVDQLRDRLDAEFRAATTQPVYNPDVQLRFAPYPKNYTAIYNCNTAVLEWLEALGCTWHGPGLYADFAIDPPSSK